MSVLHKLHRSMHLVHSLYTMLICCRQNRTHTEPQLLSRTPTMNQCRSHTEAQGPLLDIQYYIHYILLLVSVANLLLCDWKHYLVSFGGVTNTDEFTWSNDTQRGEGQPAAWLCAEQIVIMLSARICAD
jgi:hypothetical protein